MLDRYQCRIRATRSTCSAVDLALFTRSTILDEKVQRWPTAGAVSGGALAWIK